jgi:hypothetical protein
MHAVVDGRDGAENTRGDDDDNGAEDGGNDRRGPLGIGDLPDEILDHILNGVRTSDGSPLLDVEWRWAAAAVDARWRAIVTSIRPEAVEAVWRALHDRDLPLARSHLYGRTVCASALARLMAVPGRADEVSAMMASIQGIATMDRLAVMVASDVDGLVDAALASATPDLHPAWHPVFTALDAPVLARSRTLDFYTYHHTTRDTTPLGVLLRVAARRCRRRRNVDAAARACPARHWIQQAVFDAARFDRADVVGWLFGHLGPRPEPEGFQTRHSFFTALWRCASVHDAVGVVAMFLDVTRGRDHPHLVIDAEWTRALADASRYQPSPCDAAKGGATRVLDMACLCDNLMTTHGCSGKRHDCAGNYHLDNVITAAVRHDRARFLAHLIASRPHVPVSAWNIALSEAIERRLSCGGVVALWLLEQAWFVPGTPRALEGIIRALCVMRSYPKSATVRLAALRRAAERWPQSVDDGVFRRVVAFVRGLPEDEVRQVASYGRRTIREFERCVAPLDGAHASRSPPDDIGGRKARLDRP